MSNTQQPLPCPAKLPDLPEIPYVASAMSDKQLTEQLVWLTGREMVNSPYNNKVFFHSAVAFPWRERTEAW